MHVSRRTRLLILIATVATLMALTGCADKEPTDNTPTPVANSQPTAAPTPTPKQVGVSIMANGAIRAASAPVPVIAMATGELLELAVAPGDTVSKGDVVAVLDDTLAQEQVAQSEIELQRARIALDKLREGPDKAQLAAAKASVAAAESEYARLTEPPTEERLAASRATLHSAQAALDALVASGEPDSPEIRIAERQLEQAKNGLWSAQIQRDTACGQVGRGGSQAACDSANASVYSSEESVRIAEIQLDEIRQGPTNQALASARAQVAAAQAELDALLAGPSAESVAASQASVEQAQASLQALLAGASAYDVALSEANVAQAEMGLASSQRNLDQCTVTAPADGMVTSLAAAEGTWIANGASVASLQDVANLEFVTANLSERDVALIAPGQESVVSLKAFPAEDITGEVLRIERAPGEMVGDATTFPVVIALSPSDLDLMPGMTGRVEIRGK